MTHLQADIPERREELLERTHARGIAVLHEGQQIDVRTGKEQATPESANGKEGSARDIAQARRPHMDNDPPYRIATSTRQRAGIGAVTERRGKRPVHIVEQLAQCPARLRRHARARHRIG